MSRSVFGFSGGGRGIGLADSIHAISLVALRWLNVVSTTPGTSFPVTHCVNRLARPFPRSQWIPASKIALRAAASRCLPIISERGREKVGRCGRPRLAGRAARHSAPRLARVSTPARACFGDEERKSLHLLSPRKMASIPFVPYTATSAFEAEYPVQMRHRS